MKLVCLFFKCCEINFHTTKIVFHTMKIGIYTVECLKTKVNGFKRNLFKEKTWERFLVKGI